MHCPFGPVHGRSSEITLEVVSETAGLAGRDHLFSLADTVLRQNGGQALEQIDELHKASKDMVRLCEELAGHFLQFNAVENYEESTESDCGFSG